MITQIGIIGGSGNMGRIFTEQFRRIGKTVRTSDKDNQSQEKEVVTQSELIIISVPIEITLPVVKRIKRWLHKDQILTDFTSVKHFIIPEMLKTEASVISCHPMFGPMPDITGQNVILLPIRENKFYHKMERLFQELKVNVVKIEDWKKHDEYMSFIQGLMHFVHIVFTQTLFSKDVDLNTLLSICSPVYMANFAFSCRILSRDSHLYTHILMDNPKNVEILKGFIENATESLKLIQKKDAEQFQHNFANFQNYLGDFAENFGRQSEFLVEKMREFNNGKKEEN